MKLLILIISFITILFSSEGNISNLNSFIGNVGEDNLSIVIDKNDTYKITLVKNLSVDKKYILISEGSYENNIFSPKIFKKTIESKNKIDKSSYIFNSNDKILIYEKLILEKLKSTITFDDKEDDSYYWDIKVNTLKLNYYLEEDILSFIFNISKYINNENSISLIACDINNKCLVNIKTLVKEEEYIIKKKMDTSDKIILIKTNSKIFLKDNTNIYVSIDKNGKTSKIMIL